MDFQTLEQLAAVADARTSASSPPPYPAQFRRHSARSRRRRYAEALQLGRDVYVGQACWHCHSQYVRVVSNEEQRCGRGFDRAGVPERAQPAAPVGHAPRRARPRRARREAHRTTGTWRTSSTRRTSCRPRSCRPTPSYFDEDGVPTRDGIALVDLPPVARDHLPARRAGDAVSTRSAGAGTRRGVLVFFALAVTAAGCMFTFKLIAFLKHHQARRVGGFRLRSDRHLRARRRRLPVLARVGLPDRAVSADRAAQARDAGRVREQERQRAIPAVGGARA